MKKRMRYLEELERNRLLLAIGGEPDDDDDDDDGDEPKGPPTNQ